MGSASDKVKGPILSRDEKEFSQMNLRLPVPTRAKLDAEALATGVSPTELIRRMIEARPVGYEAPVREAVRLALLDLVVDAVTVPLKPERRADLAKVSEGLGFLEPEDFLKELTLRAVADQAATENFLFGAIRSESELAMTAAASAPTSTSRRGSVKKVA